MSVGHSRLTKRRPSGGASASSSCSSRSTPSFSSAAASPMSWLTSEITSVIRISRRSSLAPARLRTTIRPGHSSITVGGVIQFCGLKPPVSAWTMTDPSDLSMSSRSASGSTAVRRPV